MYCYVFDLTYFVFEEINNIDLIAKTVIIINNKVKNVM